MVFFMAIYLWRFPVLPKFYLWVIALGFIVYKEIWLIPLKVLFQEMLRSKNCTFVFFIFCHGLMFSSLGSLFWKLSFQLKNQSCTLLSFSLPSFFFVFVLILYFENDNNKEILFLSRIDSLIFFLRHNQYIKFHNRK